MSDNYIVGSVVFNPAKWTVPDMRELPFIAASHEDAKKMAETLNSMQSRIDALEGALRELMRVDEIGRDPNTHAESWRPLKRAAWERAQNALK